MKFPAQIQYACQAMVELSLNYLKEEPIQLQAIAASQKIPEKFLVQILSRLKNAGLIISYRGNAGGYKLAKKPNEITLADIVRIIDPDLIEYYHTAKKGEKKAGNVLMEIWGDINQTISERMEDVRLEDIINKIKIPPVMYHI